MICDSYAYICIFYEIRRRNKDWVTSLLLQIIKKKHYITELYLKIIDTIIINAF